MQQSALSRRNVLKHSTLLTAGLFVGTASRTVFSQSPNDKLNIASIGVGGRGGANVNGLASQNLVAFADVDDERAAGAYKKYPKAKTYRDYRKLLDAHGAELDAVVISTPDHMHFHPALAAMQLGLHVYLEKPLAHNVWETRVLTDLARKKGLATQLGAQRHAIPNMARVVEIIRSGAIGAVTEVYSWCGGGRGMPKIPQNRPPVPSTLDYELWVGPAPYRPYHPSFCPYGWRFWWDYGTGEAGNWGCHILDIPFWALDLKYPLRVDATGPAVDPERTPKSKQARYTFPARGQQPPVTLHWSHGKPADLDERKIPTDGANTVFIGTKGILACDFGQYKLLPESEFADFTPPEPSIPASPGFHNEWIAACRGEGPATCHFDYAGPLAETVLLGNVAYRVGGFDWDPRTLTAKGNEKAQPLLRETYRPGWEVTL